MLSALAGDCPYHAEALHRASLIRQNKSAVPKLSSEDGEVEELDGDLDDDGWEEESEDDS